MEKPVKEVRDMWIDEVSLVDRPANQFAKVAIAKRAPEEEAMPEFYDAPGGNVVDTNELQFGDVVFDAEGNEYEFVPEEDEVEEQELATVGKSASFSTESIREELSKALTDIERDEVISKALGEVAKAEARMAEAERIAKSERDLRLTREYISKAAEYNVPIAPEELGPVLYAMAEAEFDGGLPQGTCSVIHKALSAAGSMLFEELGFQGGGDNEDVFSQVEAAVKQSVSKAAGNTTEAAALAEFFEANPEFYDAYLAEQQ